MTDNHLFCFDVLPVRPTPLPLESFNSYVKRLAQINGIPHIHAVIQMTDLSGYHFLSNTPPRFSFKRLPTITALSVAQLLTMTFHHLGWKFGRHESLTAFLKKSVSPFVRYCPHCLQEKGYYSLDWSFLWLTGCPQHGVHLLDICGHCGQHIPLKNRHLSLYNCPFCQGDLRLSATTPLPPEQHQLCIQRQDDLVYLLTEQPWQKTQPEVVGAARQRLAANRLIQQLTIPQLASLLGTKRDSVMAIENETLSCIGELFRDYLLYIDHFGLTLSQVFKEATQTGYIHKEQLRKDAFFSQVRETVHALKQ